jgi:hypothetical protein
MSASISRISFGQPLVSTSHPILVMNMSSPIQIPSPDLECRLRCWY